MGQEIPSKFKASLMDQAEYMDRIRSNQQFHYVLSLDGRLDETKLARAVRLTLDAEPVLGCRFVERFRWPYWERRDDLDAISLVSVCESLDTEGHMMDFMTAASDPRSDPLVQARIFRAGTDTVCVKVDHIASDAGGVKEYMYLLCSTFHRLATDPGFEPAPNVNGDRSLRQVFKLVGVGGMAGAMRCGFPVKLAWGFPWRQAGDKERSIAVRRVPAESFRAVRNFGRERGVTVNDCILAAYYRALFELVDPQPDIPLPLQVPIDLRRYMPDGRAQAICNLSGQLYPMVERKPHEDFTGTVIRVRDVMNGFKANRPGIGAAAYIALFMEMGFSVTRRVYDIMVKSELRSGKSHPFLSNFGILSSEELDFGDVTIMDAYLVSPILFPAAFLLGASSYEGTLTLTVGFSNATANRPVVERFLDLMQGELAATSG